MTTPEQIQLLILNLPGSLPRSDLEPFDAESGVQLKYVTSTEQCCTCDAILLPGTQSPFEDIAWMHERGWDGALFTMLKRATPILGLGSSHCLLGTSLFDATQGRERAGLNHLNMKTELLGASARTDWNGFTANDLLVEAGTDLSGYQMGTIHTLRAPNCAPFARSQRKEEAAAGGISPDGLVVGIPFQGIFYHPLFRRAWLKELRRAR